MILALFAICEIWNEILNWKNYRNGLHYLCTEDYLKQPTSMNKWEFSKVLTGYLVVAAGLFLLIHFMPFGSLELILKK